MSPADVAVPDSTPDSAPDHAPEGSDPIGRPSSTAAVRRGYLDQAFVGYLVYGVGAVTAFIAVKLTLSDAEAGLHSSALAVGTVLAGLTTNRLERLAGMTVMHYLGRGLLTAAAILLAWAPGLPVTLTGAGAAGLGTVLVLGHVNQIMTAGGGALARVRLTRSLLLAIITSVTVPLFIALGVAIGVGWELALVPALILSLIHI